MPNTIVAPTNTKTKYVDNKKDDDRGDDDDGYEVSDPRALIGLRERAQTAARRGLISKSALKDLGVS